jgi:hypothetical protein
MLPARSVEMILPAAAGAWGAAWQTAHRNASSGVEMLRGWARPVKLVRAKRHGYAATST